MTSEFYTDIDRFAVTLEELLGESLEGVEERLPGAVKRSCQVGRKEVKRLSKTTFRHGREEKYPKGWTFKMKSKNGFVSGEIGNKLVPGLPHLLEKGHAKVGGGRVPGREHISTAADKAFEALERNVKEAVDKGL